MRSLLTEYEFGSGYDEMFEAPGRPRPHYRAIVDALNGLSAQEIAERKQRANAAFQSAGITFTVYNENIGTERIFPFDLVPRVIAAAEWKFIERGMKQRILALNAFVQDVYNDQRIITSGVIPADVIYGSPNYLPAMHGFTPPNGAWVHIAGIDLVRDKDGTLYVLEDNTRTPSGVSYVLQNRVISTRTLPSLFGSADVLPVGDYANRLHDAIRRCSGDEPVVVLTPGVYNSAYYEHTFLAKQMGVQLVEGRDLTIHNGRVAMRTTRGLLPVGSVYRRVDDDFLDPLTFNRESVLGVAGLFDAYRAGNVNIINAPGTGIADDKSIYPFVPEMIRFYLGEAAILPNVPTFRGADEKECQHILTHLQELVVKPTTASGGYGVVIGHQADSRELDALATSIQLNPGGFVAQPLIHLSTCPSIIDGEYRPRRVDFRPFVLFDGVEPWVLPGGLTRVALIEGSFIVNSSQGGGSKDTWVLNGAP